MRKKICFTLTLITFSYIAFAQFEGSKQTYSSPKLKEEVTRHKVVAILPFQTAITYKRPPKNYNAEANKNEELTIAKNLQRSLLLTV